MKDEKLVLLDYSFLFNPDSGWDHLYKFEKDMEDFFAAWGYEVQVIRSVEGANSKRVMYIYPVKPDKLKEVIRKNDRPQNVQAHIKGMQAKFQTSQQKFMKGKKNGNRK